MKKIYYRNIRDKKYKYTVKKAFREPCGRFYYWISNLIPCYTLNDIGLTKHYYYHNISTKDCFYLYKNRMEIYKELIILKTYLEGIKNV